MNDDEHVDDVQKESFRRRDRRDLDEPRPTERCPERIPRDDASRIASGFLKLSASVRDGRTMDPKRQVLNNRQKRAPIPECPSGPRTPSTGRSSDDFKLVVAHTLRDCSELPDRMMTSGVT